VKDINKFIKYKNIYFIGIGGVSMSGIAHTLKHFGYNVAGSDTSFSDSIQLLLNNDIPVFIGHNINNIRNYDLVVYTAAISNDDPELLEAKRLNIPTMDRSVFLGLLTKFFKETITISGTHGKTTTTSMISLCFLNAKLDPSIQVGAYLKNISGNYIVGNSNYFILEACEYVESFLHFFPKSAVILNIDNDHLDYFKNIDNIQKAFEKYANLLPSDGLLVTNADDQRCIEISNICKAKVITYGIQNTLANCVAKNIVYDDNGFPEFDVYMNEKFYEHVKLSVTGEHNVLNALACICMCSYYGIDSKIISSTLHEFTGANRRMEFKGKLPNNVSIFDDYAHHPTEIRATALGLKKKKYHQSWAIFQPHTYSRTKNLLDDFARVLLNFDNIVITDVYAAREKDIYGISAKDLANKVKDLGGNVVYISSFNEIVKYIKENISENDIVLTIGAGTVTQIGPMLLK
jgi:UDP-N-acetylmuramate--alanine ligase